MKRYFTLLIACVFYLQLFAQEADTIPSAPEVPAVPEVPEVAETPEVSEAPEYGDTVNVMNRVEVIETPETTRVTVGQNEVVIVEENGDTVKVKLGNRGVSIVEGPNGTEIKVLDMDDFPSSSHKHKKKKFRPHYAGIELGLANYLTPDNSLTLPPEDSYMDLNTGRSYTLGINVVDVGVGFGTDKIGLASGLGFEFTNYNFNGQNSIRKDPVTGVIGEYVPHYVDNITKSKMTMWYINVPLLIEFQIPAGRKRVNLSMGVVGGLKLFSRTKMKYVEAGSKSKEVARGDYNLYPLRWGTTARVGYGFMHLYATYYPTSLFKKDLGPQVYPLNVGLFFAF
jgi:hypothetical protein